jgi:hypothetical protein
MGINTRFNDYDPGNMNATDFPPDLITTETQPALNYVCPMNPMEGGECSIQQSGQVVRTTLDGDMVGFNYAAYSSQLQSGNYTPTANGVALRRQFAVPVADCNGAATGQSTLPVIGFACFFLLQRVPQGGGDNYIFGEVINSCGAGGNPGPTPGPVGGSGPERIVLYNDVRSPDS